MRYLVLFFLLVGGALTAADDRVAPGINAFTVATYQQVAQGSGNLILSPFNIATALSMAMDGARGKTATEMANTLHQHYDASYDAALSTLARELAEASNSGGNQLLLANRLWAQRGFPIEPAFEKSLSEHYHAPLTPLDFKGNPNGARNEINHWTAQQTKDRIKEIMGPGSIRNDSRMILTSAIYFYGKWQEPFQTSRTQPGTFTPDSGSSLQANFMNQTSHFGYTETSSSQILEMQYAGTGIAFDVLLPKKGSRLGDVEKSFTSEDLKAWLGRLGSARVQVTFPKFRAEATFSLSKELASMGMPLAFSNDADFSGISTSRLKISDVLHKAYVDVTEEGTEAAAVTATHMVMAAARPAEQPVVFRADHPFLFLIRDTRSGVILFIGRVLKP